MKFDETDIEIIKLLRKDARVSITKIAKELGLPINTVAVRYRKIKRSGIIKKTFLPTFLPQYAKGQSETFKIQMLLKVTNVEIPKVIEFIQNLNIEHAQIECWETIGHFNILAWIISEDPIDYHLIQEKIGNQAGIIETKACVISYRNYVHEQDRPDLSHLKEIRING